jgi:hypothetical protein
MMDFLERRELIAQIAKKYTWLGDVDRADEVGAPEPIRLPPCGYFTVGHPTAPSIDHAAIDAAIGIRPVVVETRKQRARRARKAQRKKKLARGLREARKARAKERMRARMEQTRETLSADLTRLLDIRRTCSASMPHIDLRIEQLREQWRPHVTDVQDLLLLCDTRPVSFFPLHSRAPSGPWPEDRNIPCVFVGDHVPMINLNSGHEPFIAWLLAQLEPDDIVYTYRHELTAGTGPTGNVYLRRF